MKYWTYIINYIYASLVVIKIYKYLKLNNVIYSILKEKLNKGFQVIILCTILNKLG